MHRLRPDRLLAALMVALLLPLALACGGSSSGSGNTLGTSAPRRDKLVIAVQPTSTAEQLAADAKQLEQFLSQRLNRPVELVFPTSSASPGS